MIEQSLAPYQQFYVDMAKIIRDQAPDKNGKTLPLNLTSGTYRLRDLTDQAVGNLFEGKVITDKRYGHAAYGCMICCGYPDGGYMAYDPFGILVQSSGMQQVHAVNSCWATEDNLTGYYGSWWTDDTNIATATMNQINGMGVGDTNNFAYGVINVGDDLHRPYCPQSTDQPVGGVNVNPTIQITSTTLNPTTLTSTGSVTLTVQMQLLGSVTSNQSLVLNVSTASTNPPGIGVHYDQTSKTITVTSTSVSPLTQSFTITPGASFATGQVVIGSSLSTTATGITVKDPSPASNAQATLTTSN